MKTRHEIEELTNHPEIQAAAELLRAAKTLMDELAAERHDSVAKFVAYELAATQWARASNKFETLLREALA
jgi:formylmethanofuran dehydrogenase subunit A